MATASSATSSRSRRSIASPSWASRSPIEILDSPCHSGLQHRRPSGCRVNLGPAARKPVPRRGWRPRRGPAGFAPTPCAIAAHATASDAASRWSTGRSSSLPNRPFRETPRHTGRPNRPSSPSRARISQLCAPSCRSRCRGRGPRSRGAYPALAIPASGIGRSDPGRAGRLRGIRGLAASWRACPACA